MTPRPKSNALIWLLLSVLVIIVDQASKVWALAALQPYNPHPVIAGFLNWNLAFNRGAAFSFLSDGSGWQRGFFIVLALVISVILVVWLRRTRRSDWRTGIPLALIIGGAIGNVIDRIRFGMVTDFIQVYYQHWAWPTFNLADSAISVGAVALIVFGLFAQKQTTEA